VDSLATKKRGSTKERLLATASKERKEKFNHLQAEEVIHQLLWTELVAVIVKEWPVFSNVFSDRVQFQQHVGIVNIRYDAHAKHADIADFAEYRRSVKWLADQISKI